MYIHGVQYLTNLRIYHDVKEYMIYNVYNHQEYVDELMGIIKSKIDCIDIDFDTMRYQININIKKTTMRRAKGYKASSMYYYGIINSVFDEFFHRHPEITRQIEQWVYNISFYNLCQINCIGDKSISIVLM